MCIKWVTLVHLAVYMSKNTFIKDNNVLRSLAMGDQQAFQQVYKDCYAIVTRSIQNMNASKNEAEAIYHASLLVLYEKAKEADFTLECKLSTFVIAVARKKWLKQLDKEKRLTEKERNYAELHGNEAANALFDIHTLQKQEVDKAQLVQSLEKLGSPCNKILMAFYIEGKKMSEIAQTFNYTNEQNAKTQKHKCLKRLKKIFFE